MRSNRKSGSFKAQQPVASTAELARLLGLSRWTVSRVLNGHEGVHPETVERVRRAMQEHHFTPNPLAQGLRRGSTRIIGVCVPELDEFYLTDKLEALRQTLEAAGYHLLVSLATDEEAEATALDRFHDLRVAGIVVFATRLAGGHRTMLRLAKGAVPLVCVDPRTGDAPPGSLLVDRAHAMREAVEHLAALGHRRFALIGLSGEGRYTRERLAGAQEALRTLDLPEAVRLPLPQAVSFYEAGAIIGERLAASLGERRSPTAFLAVNDQVAIGLIRALGKAGLQVPECCSVIGYDRMEVGAYLSPPLTTIDPRPDALMNTCVEQLLAAMSTGTTTPAQPLVARLLPRGTTGPAPKERIKKTQKKLKE